MNQPEQNKQSEPESSTKSKPKKLSDRPTRLQKLEDSVKYHAEFIAKAQKQMRKERAMERSQFMTLQRNQEKKWKSELSKKMTRFKDISVDEIVSIVSSSIEGK